MIGRPGATPRKRGKQEEDNTNNLEITITAEERQMKKRTISRILEITIPTSR
jgi:hypothetical protein